MKHRTGSSWPLGDDLEFDLLELEFNVLDRPAKLKVVFASTAAKKPLDTKISRRKKTCQIKNDQNFDGDPYFGGFEPQRCQDLQRMRDW